jgi:hypothetical protein
MLYQRKHSMNVTIINFDKSTLQAMTVPAPVLFKCMVNKKWVEKFPDDEVDKKKKWKYFDLLSLPLQPKII